MLSCGYLRVGLLGWVHGASLCHGSVVTASVTHPSVACAVPLAPQIG